MMRAFLGVLSLVVLGLAAPTAVAAHARGKTITSLSGAIPLEIFQRSVPAKFYRSLLVSPLDDWSIVRAQLRGRLSGARVIRAAANPAYDALALKYASELPLVANDPGGRAGQSDSAIMHLLVYKIADGVMAVSFAYPESPPGPQTRTIGTVRVSVRTKEGRWTEITPAETQEDRRRSVHESGGRNTLRKIDRVPIHYSSSAPR